MKTSFFKNDVATSVKKKKKVFTSLSYLLFVNCKLGAGVENAMEFLAVAILKK